MTPLSLSPIPGELNWKNDPVDWNAGADGSLSVTGGAKTDWFIDPANNGLVVTNAPVVLFTPPDQNFLLSAKVTVNFAAKFDAGVLMLYERDDLWAKVCFEYSPQNQPMIVSVVTRGFSDDCNSTVIDGNSIYLRVARMGDAFAFHYSQDGHYWNFVRYLTMGKVENLKAGLLAQSPAGQGCSVVFSEMLYHPDTLKDLRSGQ